jgi:signal transduction histidine kinase/ligand-binding sensor domain-containing protein
MQRSLFILLLFAGLQSPAQVSPYVFTNYATTQGLPDNNVQSIVTDSRGFLWAATTEGLSRFDGKQFKNFFADRQDRLVQGNYFNNLYEYKKGHLVVANAGQNIGFDTYTETFYRLPISHITNAGLSKAGTGRGWLLATFNKLYLLNDRLRITDSVATPEPGGSNYLSGIYLNPQALLLQVRERCYSYHIPSRTVRPLSIDFGFTGNIFIPYLRYYDAARQQLWFSEYQMGLYRHSLRTGRTEHMQFDAKGQPYTRGFVYQILPVGDSVLWMLTTWGIRILHLPSNTVTAIEADKGNPGSLPSNSVYAYCTDASGNRWFGTSNGLGKLNAQSLRFTAYNKGFATVEGSGLMSLVKGPDGNMHFSVYEGKAYTLNPTTHAIFEWAHPANNGNWNLFVRGQEIVRTGRGNRLLAYNTTTLQYYPLDFLRPWLPGVELVVMGFVHSNGDEWYCGNRGGGFVRKLAGTNNYKTYRKDDGRHQFANGYYTSYAEDTKGDLWFGVNKTDRLLHWQKEADRFDEVDFSQLPSVGHHLTGINALACDTAGNVWIAFNGSGLLCYSPINKQALRYTLADGLPSDFITGLRFDGRHRLWATTVKGLSCLVMPGKKFVNFRREDGLPADDFTDYCNYYDAATNQLWLGTQSVLMHFDPDELLAMGRKQFPVYIDELYLNGKHYTGPLAPTLQLRPGENNLQFHFVGVDLNKGKEIEYSYRLLGADAGWNPTGTNQTASYANLKPGSYTFTVRARYRGDNQWQETGDPIHFIIATPWHSSWWFLLLLAAAAALLVWYFVKTYYARRLEKERALLERQRAIEQERTRIATDMHDDFGASLSRIKFLSEKIKLQGQEGAALQADLGKISGYSDEMAEKMGEIVWALNQKYDTLGDLVAFCRAYASEYLSAHQIELGFEAVASERPLKGETRRNLFLVLKESLHNTVKHAGASRVDLFFHERDGGLHITVRDNGCGLGSNIRPFANGLENMKKRIRDCGGSIKLYNNKGLVVEILIPLVAPL